MPFQSRQFLPARITRMPSCPSTMTASARDRRASATAMQAKIPPRSASHVNGRQWSSRPDLEAAKRISQTCLEPFERRGDARDLASCALSVLRTGRLGQLRKRLAVVKGVDVPAEDDVSVPAVVGGLAVVEEELFHPREHVVEAWSRGRRQAAGFEAVVYLPLERRRRRCDPIDRGPKGLQIRAGRPGRGGLDERREARGVMRKTERQHLRFTETQRHAAQQTNELRAAPETRVGDALDELPRVVIRVIRTVRIATRGAEF